MANSLGIDPKKFKHVSSDDKSTTLQHKDGHTLTIAHNVLNPKMKEQLLALAKVPKEEPQKMWGGGEADKFAGNPQTPPKVIKEEPKVIPYSRGAPPKGFDYARKPEHIKTPEESDDLTPYGREQAAKKSGEIESDAKGGRIGYDEGGSVLDSATDWYHKQAKAGTFGTGPQATEQAESNKKAGESQSKAGIQPQNKAYGGDVSCSGDKKGVSTQGEIIRNKESKHQAKAEASGRADMERHVKPKMKGLAEGGECYACGGPVHKYAEGEEVKKEDKKEEEQAPHPGIETQQDQSPMPDQMSAQQDPSNTPSQPQAQQSTQPGPEAQSDQQAAPVPEAQPQADVQPQPTASASAVQQPAAPSALPSFDSIPAIAEPMAEPGQPMSARQQAIFQVQNAKATQEQHEENMKFAQDVQNGHISPKTYKDLFHDRSTTGKISMIFGLMLGGIGAGMAHTQNAYLNMMDKTIANDLEAQKQSKSNANNFVKMNVDNELQKVNTQLTQSQVPLTKANAQLVKNNAGTIALNNSAIQMYTTAMKELMDRRAKTAEGTPERAAADTALSQFFQRFGDKITNATAAIAGAQAQNSMLFGEPGTGATGSTADRFAQAFNAHQLDLRKQAQFNPEAQRQYDINQSKYVPGYDRLSDLPVNQQTRDVLQSHDKFNMAASKLSDLIKNNKGNLKVILNPANPVGKLAQQQALILQSLFREGTLGTVYREGEQPLLDKAIASNPLALTKYFTEGAKLKGLMDSNKMFKDITAKAAGLHPIQEQPMQQKQLQQPAPQYKEYNGKKYMRGPSGESIEVK